MTQTQTASPPANAGMPVNDAIMTINSLVGQDRKDAMQQLGLRPPDGLFTNWIWMIIAITFAVILMGASVSLALAVFAYGKLSADLLLTIFTTASAFLIGLLAPSPAQAKSS